MDTTHRSSLCHLNSLAWNGQQSSPATAKLDSSLKKNTAFIKKIRTSIDANSESSLLDGIAKLSLEKYLNELLSAVSEALTRVSKGPDVNAAVEVVSALHQRFDTRLTPFIMLYFAHFLAPLSTPLSERDEKDRLSKLKNLVILLMEFSLSGIFTTVDVMPEDELPRYLSRLKSKQLLMIVPCLREVLSMEFASGNTLSIASSFVKQFSEYLTKENEFLPEESRGFLLKLLDLYTENAVAMTERLYTDISSKHQKAQIIALKTGHIQETMEAEAAQLQTRFDKFQAFCETSAKYMGSRAPKLVTPLEQRSTSDAKVQIVSSSSKVTTDLSLWESDDAKKFYSGVPELSTLVPDAILSQGDGKTEDESKGTQMTDIMIRLDECISPKDVDKVVQDYWLSGLNNKASRNRLFRHFTESIEIYKFRNYARFLKINQSYMPELLDDLIDRLDKSLRFQMHHDAMTEKVILFFGELVKFKLIPIHVLFHKVRTLILNVDVSNNIEILSLLFDSCGRMLLYDAEYSDHTKELIALLGTLKDTRTFSPSDSQAVKIFLLSLYPPSVNKVAFTDGRTNEEKFMTFLVKQGLTADNYKIILAAFKRIDWANEINVRRIEEIFSKPEEVSYELIPEFAKIFRHLCIGNMQSSLKVHVIDSLLESIIVGLEDNDYRKNRTRLAEVRYLAELFNLKMLGKSLITTVLYRILCNSHKDNYPTPAEVCEVDPPESFFRVRLICTLLSNLSLLRISSKKVNSDLRVFYRFFDYYTWTKVQPLPMEIVGKLDDLSVSLQEQEQQFERSSNFKDSVERLQKVMVEQGLRSEETEEVEETEEGEEAEDEIDEIEVEEEIDVESDEESEEETDETEEESDEDAEEETEEESEEDTEEESVSESDPEDTDELYSREVEERFNEELEKELGKLRLEAMTSSKSSAILSGSGNLSSPSMLLKANSGTGSPAESRSGSDNGNRFTFLSHAGQKVAARALKLPENAKFTRNYTEETEKIRREKEAIKSIVLSSLQRSE
ncbi:DEKNAAC101085 [Brettanomyces naardenensis]|uniref:DEKNAAC101085 n=1 Tax=Brettanomyces naardenensis TaxID=13370 RepID=A0A448YHH8_BRENA|nr:DEKNAAC101085 [Brettanomyces naardenensis]